MTSALLAETEEAEKKTKVKKGEERGDVPSDPLVDNLTTR